MSTLRDLPPVSGQIVWARQIERQLNSYLQRVEHVLGKGWANHPAGVELKEIGDKFKNKLDANKIFKMWWQKIQVWMDRRGGGDGGGGGGGGRPYR
jgi:dynein heavy chain 1